MIYTKLTNKAIKMAYDAHHGSVDKSGIPYVFHPYHIAEQMDCEISVCVALLHDVIEDTDVSFSLIEEMGFPKQVIESLKLLTRDEVTSYEEYIQKIKDSNNDIAIKVKLADLRHNSDISRFDDANDRKKHCEHNKKYGKAIILMGG